MYYHGVSIEKDPRLKAKLNEDIIRYPQNVTEKLSISNINYEAFLPWITRELKKYTEDDFLPEIVVVFLQSDEIDSQELGRNLQPDLKENTVGFVSALWDLLIDAENNGIGIPKVILDETKNEIEEKMKKNMLINKKLNEETSSDSSSSDTYSSEDESDKKTNIHEEIKEDESDKKVNGHEDNDLNTNEANSNSDNDNFYNKPKDNENNDFKCSIEERKDYYDDFPDEENESFAKENVFYKKKHYSYSSSKHHHHTRHESHRNPHSHHHHSSRHRH